MRGDAVIAHAEHRIHPVETLERRATRSRDALVAGRAVAPSAARCRVSGHLSAGKRGAAEMPEEQLGVIPLFRSGLGMRAVTVAH